MAKDTAENRISRARIQLLLQQPFFGTLILYLDPIEREAKDMQIPTMSTDGKHLYYCAEYVMSLPDIQLQTVLVHEIGHVMLDHLDRCQGRISMKWNWAADFAVNDLIVNTTDDKGQHPFQLPPGVLINSKWHDQTAEEIYTHLPDPPSSGGGGNAGKGAGSGNQKGKSDMPGPTLDDHSDWKDWAKDQSAEQTKQDWKDRVARAAAEARTRGKMPGGWQSVIDEFLEPKLDWKTIIQDVIVTNSKNDYRLFPPNKKHIWRGFYLPSQRGEEINVMYGMDVSGSISEEEILEGLSELKGICDQFTDYTIYGRTFDTEIHDRWELHPFDPVPKVVTGRGGTDFTEICEEAEKTPGITTLLIFSDLEAPFPPEPKIPVIWLSVSDKKAPWGLTIKYPRK